MIGYGLRLSAVGIAAGLAAALLLTRGMTSMLVGTKASDPPSFGAMAVLFFLIARLATWIPALRAASLDPANRRSSAANKVSLLGPATFGVRLQLARGKSKTMAQSDPSKETRKNNCAAPDVARTTRGCSAETHLDVLGASW